MRSWVWVFSLLCGCVVYDQDVLWQTDVAAVPSDLAQTSSDLSTPMCGWQELSSMCKEHSAWVSAAARACCDLFGQQLRSLQFGSVCPQMGSFGARQVRFECCPSDDPNPTTHCETRKLGFGECLDDAIWKQRAATECGNSGRIVSSTSQRLSSPCGPGRYSGIVFDCCTIPCPTPITR